MDETIRLSQSDIQILRREAEAVARRHSSASRFAIEIAERFNLVTGVVALNICEISDDPDWTDTDLNTTHPWSRIRDRHRLVNGRALFDLFIYERHTASDIGDLVCNAQAELDGKGLLAIHADSDTDVWRRPSAGGPQRAASILPDPATFTLSNDKDFDPCA